MIPDMFSSNIMYRTTEERELKRIWRHCIKYVRNGQLRQREKRVLIVRSSKRFCFCLMLNNNAPMISRAGRVLGSPSSQILLSWLVILSQRWVHVSLPSQHFLTEQTSRHRKKISFLTTTYVLLTLRQWNRFLDLSAQFRFTHKTKTLNTLAVELVLCGQPAWICGSRLADYLAISHLY